MVKGIGTDIIEIARLGASLERTKGRLLERILTESERLEYRRKFAISEKSALSFFAKRFAAKEAVGKALGSGIGQGVSWQDISLVSDELGAPQVQLSGVAQERLGSKGATNCHVSLSDEQEYAVAFVVLD